MVQVEARQLRDDREPGDGWCARNTLARDGKEVDVEEPVGGVTEAQDVRYPAADSLKKSWVMERRK